jgi:hypothetical protein
MLLNFCFIFPTGILNWMSLSFDQVFKILFSPGLSANPFVNYDFHLWIFSYRHLFCPLNFFFFIFFSFFFTSIGYKYSTLNIGEIPTPSGNSISYAFAPNFLMTLHYPIFFIFSLLIVSLGNLSFLRCERIRSPTSNLSSRLCLSTLCLYS